MVEDGRGQHALRVVVKTQGESQFEVVSDYLFSEKWAHEFAEALTSCLEWLRAGAKSGARADARATKRIN